MNSKNENVRVVNTGTIANFAMLYHHYVLWELFPNKLNLPFLLKQPTFVNKDTFRSINYTSNIIHKNPAVFTVQYIYEYLIGYEYYLSSTMCENSNMTWSVFKQFYIDENTDYFFGGASMKMCWDSISKNRSITFDIVVDNAEYIDMWDWSELSKNPRVVNPSTIDHPLIETRWVDGISSNPSITMEWVLERCKDYIFNWRELSANPGVASMGIIRKYPQLKDKWIVFGLYKNPNITPYDIVDNPDIFGDVSYYNLSFNPNLDWREVVKYPRRDWNWEFLSSNPMIRVPAAILIQRWWRRVRRKLLHKRIFKKTLDAIYGNPKSKTFMAEFMKDVREHIETYYPKDLDDE